MPKKYFRQYLPSHDAVREHRLVARFGPWLRHPNLWHLNRRSVAGGFAVGLFSGLVPGPLQMLTALLLAVSLRVNLPVALITTFYTNPFTIVPLYLFAYWIGSGITGGNGGAAPPPEFSWSSAGGWLRALFDWAVAAGPSLGIGLVTLAASLAAVGWVAVDVGWRAWVMVQWRRRKQRRAGG